MTRIELYNEDCIDAMSRMSSDSVDAFIVDPPYGIDFQSNRRVVSKKMSKIANDIEVPVDWIPYAYSLLKDTGCMFCFCRFDTENTFIEAMKKAGFFIKSEVIWFKMTHGSGDLEGAYAPSHENAIFATKTKSGFSFPYSRPEDVYDFKKVPSNALVHPNEKPLALMSRIVMDLTRPGMLVVDPYCGSGTTLLACKNAGRNAIGCEITKEYYDVAYKKLNPPLNQLSFLGDAV